MPEAAAFQSWLADAITADRAPKQAPPSFAVYRNTWLKALLDALDANYPTVAMILGADRFEAAALQFARSHSARTPVLALYGAEFPDFLANHAVADDIPYLRDVAALDRLWTECFFASDAVQLGVSRFARLRPIEMLGLSLPIHPATRIARYGTPAVTIWQAHRADGEFEEIEPEWGPEHALVTRHGMSISVSLIDEATYRLLLKIGDGCTIGDAIAATACSLPCPDIANALTTILCSAALAAPRAGDVRIW